MSPGPYTPRKCPTCGSRVIEGEYVDIGVGMQQVSPDVCDYCDWIQPGCLDEKGGRLDQRNAEGAWVYSQHNCAPCGAD